MDTVIVTDKWYDNKPACGISNTYFMTCRTLDSIAKYQVVFMDELYNNTRQDINDKILEYQEPKLFIVTSGLKKPYLITKKTIKEIKKIGSKIVFLWLDARDDKSITSETIKNLQEADLHVTLDLEVNIPEAHCIHLWTPIDTSLFVNEYIERTIDVCFIGTRTKERNDLMQILLDNGIMMFRGGGRNQNNLTHEQCNKILNMSKISINFSNSSGIHQLKGRVIESMTCGALLLESENEQIKKWYSPNQDYVAFGSAEDLLAKTRFYLENEKERLEISKNGHEKTISLYNSKNFWRRVYSEIGIDLKLP